MAVRSDGLNPRAYLDLSADGRRFGRLTFELFAEKAPKAVENFLALCTGGERGPSYEECLFYRVIPTFCACSGDYETNNRERNGGNSSFGEKYFGDEFHDELSFDARGLLGMDNYGWPNTNSSRFFITFGKCPWMDGYHTLFGRLIAGWPVLDELETYGTIEGYGAQKGRTTREIRIVECGELK